MFMEKENDFFYAVKTYLKIVENECNILVKYIEDTEQIVILNKFDLYRYFNQASKYEFEVCDRKYHIHGNGIMVVCNDGIIADWDFGCRSWWCGVEPFLMAVTLKNTCFKNVDYHDGNYIKGKCEQYLEEELLYYYKGQYYINMLKLGSMKIEFPSDYEKVIIEYKGISRSFNKCKNIDKFIRKSNAVYSKISELKDNYILIFYNNDVEVARVPYNDIAYPDSAVKIMNGEIIKPHLEVWKEQKM